MRNAVFLVKNGIGFGHIRRALLIAEAIQHAGQLRPIVISQASSLALYRNTPVRVVNFPLLHRVPSAIAEDLYTDLLNRLLDRLDPAVAIEDTYPDARYRQLPSLADRPRLLVMRRLDGLSFDQIRQRGDFAHYDQILIAQDRDAFHQEGHTGDSLAAVESSGRFTFVGNIAHTPTREEAAAARSVYAAGGAPLVIVNGGAGGDQMPDGYGDRLFTTCQTIAARLATEGHPAQFVLVTGPYYAGRTLHDTANVTVRRYEPHLPALLAAADVAVIKPGNNALSEALTGTGQLVLVPDTSFMEGLHEHAHRTAAQIGAAVGTPDRDSLEPLIREALSRGPRVRRPAASAAAIDAVVRAIHDHAESTGPPEVPSKVLMLVLIAPGSTEPDKLRAQLPESLRNAVVLDSRHDDGVVGLASLNTSGPTTTTPGAPAAALVDCDPGVSPQRFVDQGVRLLIQTGPSSAVERWLRHQPPLPALFLTSAELVNARSGSPDVAQRRIARLLRSTATTVVLLDLRALPEAAVADYLTTLGEWLASQPLHLVGVDAIRAEQANRLLMGGLR
ncbi:hypothetical protein RB614_31695 [Phytohabitans sp. ZYX-F-186]|uniref:Glycosyl transferase family 28 C-terminal domain-containing protein n=1 Tax=Phytohabitans maris TaxID=3071409 RepID=A0ABU0ZQQ4_9ACTN|nr:hypothetical protein [Phytohabitans sp. ZYX-F-186]MDQ7909096.1 hypothetical protein [Phytohabitans sp. ZYX-F-186]